MTAEKDTVTISFSGEEFRELERKAKEAGIPVEEYLTRMIDNGKKVRR